MSFIICYLPGIVVKDFGDNNMDDTDQRQRDVACQAIAMLKESVARVGRRDEKNNRLEAENAGLRLILNSEKDRTNRLCLERDALVDRVARRDESFMLLKEDVRRLREKNTHLEAVIAGYQRRRDMRI
jgi:hypothetical protein